MTTRYGFTLFTPEEFINWLNGLQVMRTIRFIQHHHTWSPSYASCNGPNHLEICRNMRNFHVDERGWSDIGQHFSTFPDGTIATGRSLERSPACIYGNNSGSICIEHVGNFDKRQDKMTGAHRDTIVSITAALCKRFNLPPDDEHIVYHHWFNLRTGQRNNGTGFNKSCPGTDFFGGNKPKHAQRDFFPLVAKVLKIKTGKPNKSLLFYAKVNTGQLNVRSGPSARRKKVGEVYMGAVLRVYEEQDNWYRISKENDEWVYGRYADKMHYGRVTASRLHVRSGPGTRFPIIETIPRGTEVMVLERNNEWLKVSVGEKWVSAAHVSVAG